MPHSDPGSPIGPSATASAAVPASAPVTAGTAAAARNQRLALLALAAMAITWGYNWVIMKNVLRYVGPMDFQALRNLLGALVLLAIVLLRRMPLRVTAWRRVFLFGLLQTTGFSVFVQLALVHGDVGKSSILTYTMPFWVIPMAWVSFGERIRGVQWLALALAAAGLVLVLEPWHGQASIVGEVMALLAGLCWALAMITAKWIKRDCPMDVLPLTTWQMLYGALVLCVIAWLVPERAIDPAPYFWGALLYNVFISTALAWALWVFALQHLSAGVVGLSALGVPVVGTLSAWLQLGEAPARMELAGMFLIVGALVVLSLRSLKR
ncbi:DMT family transporter [Castellaniella sp.]|uniref:DMT family transporter n=1 Tax=Castellaniella sp. TaxID=1955812 RepID=UPI003560EE2F